MNVLSLFDGISCGMVALEHQGISVQNYYAAEIDKYTIQISEKNYPDIIRLGDVTKWKEWDIDWTSIDLVIGGSPCQGFSFAGKQLAFNDPRSKLFFAFVDILNHIKSLNPNVKFLLENVRMKQEHLSVIDYSIETEPVLINSALVSAQSRERFYWTNWQIEQPEDRFIYLKDIIEGGCVDRDKSLCITASYRHGAQLSHYFEKAARQIVLGNTNPCGYGQNGNVYGINGKSATLTTNKGEGQKIGIFFIEQKPRGFNKGGRFYEKSPSLTSNSWQDNNHLCVTDGHREPKIQINNIADPTKYKKGKGLNGETIYWRKLTPLECERLQTLPDNYTLVLDENGKQLVSNSQRYKALGNGWTVDVIAHILSTMHIPKIEQTRLFA